MSGATLTINEREVAELLGRVAGRLSDLTPVMTEIGEILVADSADNFEAGRGPDGSRWETSQRVKISGGQVLLNTGRLRNSISYEAGKRRVSVGTSVKYAGTQQFGAKRGAFGTVAVTVPAHTRHRNGKTVRVRSHTRTQKLPWGDIPAREFLGISADAAAEINAALSGYITDPI
ncbi:phage virion morphogenesis protein [Desulfonema ishimotonii]|uniref:Phage virion morphogenesis protein n=1 Tax=Desulfonema ishimotonii TaxID=45657 RepID=A0A401FZV4_9BACT|nr:phage virion morphogenesis protein [Desulfonema ishimotonii]GBC62490.1 phage virion morphogenesis protein [Desulfonema ishimotonii]